MTPHSVEKRLDALEQAVAAIVAAGGEHNQKRDWRSTIGMFEGDPVMREIQEEGRKVREADRRKADQDVTP